MGFRGVICFILCIIMGKEMQAAVCSERTWRMMKSIPSTRQLATDSTSGTTNCTGIREDLRRCSLHLNSSKEDQHSIFAKFRGYESIQRNFRRRRDIKVFRIVICSILGITTRKEMQAAVCSERTWRMMKSILPTRQLATDSTSGTTSRNGIKRICEDVICILFRGGIDDDFGIEHVRESDSVIIG